jgi:hypothetical protein
MRQDEESEFREGIVVDRPTRPGHGSFVNCGMTKVEVGTWTVTYLRTLTRYRGRQGHGGDDLPWTCHKTPH